MNDSVMSQKDIDLMQLNAGISEIMNNPNLLEAKDEILAYLISLEANGVTTSEVFKKVKSIKNKYKTSVIDKNKDLLSPKDIDFLLLEFEISELINDPALRSAKIEVKNILIKIKKANIQISASQLLENIKQVRSKHTLQVNQ